MIVGAFETGGFPFRMATNTMQHHAHAVQTSRRQEQQQYQPYQHQSHYETTESYNNLHDEFAAFNGGARTVPALSTGRNVLCGYPSKICTNERAWKRDGSLHRFCEEHRQRANTNQKRWAKRKTRTKTDKPASASGSTSKSAHQSPAPEEYQVDDSMLMAQPPMDCFDFDMTLESLLKDATFWSPTAMEGINKAETQWLHMDEPAQIKQDEDALEVELWAALGLGNINMAL